MFIPEGAASGEIRDMSDILSTLLSTLAHPFVYLGSPVNRARLRGARIEVIASIWCRQPELQILLGQSSYHEMWMPPQEGVKLKETFEEALRRCLEVECG